MSTSFTIEVARSPEYEFNLGSDSLEAHSAIIAITENEDLDASPSKSTLHGRSATKSVFKPRTSKRSNPSKASSGANGYGTKSIANLEKPTSGPPSFRLPHVGNDTVDVLVGPKAQQFVVHKSFLCHHSPFFEKCLNGQFSEAQSGIVELEETSPDAFGLFVDWIYTGMIEVPPEDLTLRDTQAIPKTVIELWILADYLQMPDLQNYSIDLLVLMENYYVTFAASCVESWDKAKPHAQLHKFIVKKLSNTPLLGEKASLAKSPSYSLVRELLDVLTDRNRKAGLAELVASEYYV